MVNYTETAYIRTIVPVMSLALYPYQEQTSGSVPSVSYYVIGPIDPSQLVMMRALCSNGEYCPLLVPPSLPLWILAHPEFCSGYEQNYFTEEGDDDAQWKQTIPHMVNLIYRKLLGNGFEDFKNGDVDPGFGPWEIGSLLRDFTRLAETHQTLALTGIAHLCFLILFLPPEPPMYWPPAGLLQARESHNNAVKALRARIRFYREQGKTYDEAQRLALYMER